MATPNKNDGFEIGQDLEFQRKSWKVQRFGWLVMLLIVVAALLGLFGGGPLAHDDAGSKGSTLYVEYRRFQRYNSPAELRITVGPGAIRADSTARIWLDREWLTASEIKAIVPEPERSENIEDRTVYTFRVAPAAAGSLITFALWTRKIGRQRGRVGVDAGPSHRFSQFTYP